MKIKRKKLLLILLAMFRRNKRLQSGFSLQNNARGITLIEVLFSLAIISIGILGLLAVFPRGINLQKDIKDEEMAISFAQAKLEELAGTTYENILTGTIENRARASEAQSDYLYNFTRTSTVQLVDQNFNPTDSDVGLKKITVTVYWQGGISRQERSMSLLYLKSNR